MTSITTYTPFTYCLTFLLTGQRYYGVRYAKDCHPDQLWTTYFTSSKIISDLIKEYGKDAFTFEVRKTFITAEEACYSETKFLTRIDAAKSPNWLNGHNGSGTVIGSKESNIIGKKTKQLRYNDDSYNNRPKCRETKQLRYNDDSYNNRPKCTETNIEKYGFENPFQTPSIKQKIKETNIEKYGFENPFEIPLCKQKIKETNIEKYGFENPSQNPSIRARQILTYKETCKNRPLKICPYCSVSGKGGNMTRWHFDNCKLKPQ
jgi:hypothetical protein